MRTITHTQTIAKYDELTEEQKLKVIENLYNINTDHDYMEYILEDAKMLLSTLGFSDIKINYSGFSSQGDGASFTAKFTVPQSKSELKRRANAFRDIAPKEKLFNFESMIFSDEEREEETLEIYRLRDRYYHSNTIQADNEDLHNFARSFSDELYRTLEKDYYYLQSREAIEETIEANDYEFDIETLKIV